VNSNVQARLDPQSQVVLAELVRRLGGSPSRVVRTGYAAGRHVTGKLPRDRVGRFASDVPDLDSNKKYLQGFGQ